MSEAPAPPPNAPAPDAPPVAAAAPPGPPWLVRFWRQILSRPDLGIGLLLALCNYIAIRATGRFVGFVRDEGYYFKAGEQYFEWYRLLWRNVWSGRLLDTFTDATIVRAWDYNHEHPVLIKTLMGFTWWFTHEVLGIASGAEGFRVVGALFAALCTGFTFALARRAGVGRPFAVFAGMAWWLMPHNFFHSHLACFDVPVTAMTVLVVYAYLAGRRTLRGAIIAGIVFGLACATKHNALFLSILLVMHFVIARWREINIEPGPGGGLRLPPIPLAFACMLIAAPLIMYLHWPYLWHHPFTRFGSYLGYHMNHEHYPVAFGDVLLVKPPFPSSFPWLMTWFTMPETTLLLGMLGMGLGLRTLWRGWRGTLQASDGATSVDGDRPPSTMLMWGLMAIFPLALIALPGTPKFGGIKHWMPATPFIALFAALALERAVAATRGWLAERWHGWWAGGLVALALLPSLIGTVVTVGNGDSYYNSFAGLVRGGAEHNLQRTFWGHAGHRLIIDAMNQLPDGSRVFFHRTNFDSYNQYKRDGLLKSTIQYASDVRSSDYAIIFHQVGYVEEYYQVWKEYQTRSPAAGVYLEGVPLVTLYARPGKALPPGLRNIEL